MSEISWVLGTPIISAKIFDKDGEPAPVPSARWDAKLRRYQSGDRIVVLYQNGEPLATAPIRSNTTHAALSAIEHGLLRSVPSNAQGIQERISHFIRVADQKRLNKKLTNRHRQDKEKDIPHRQAGTILDQKKVAQ